MALDVSSEKKVLQYLHWGRGSSSRGPGQTRVGIEAIPGLARTPGLPQYLHSGVPSVGIEAITGLARTPGLPQYLHSGVPSVGIEAIPGLARTPGLPQCPHLARPWIASIPTLGTPPSVGIEAIRGSWPDPWMSSPFPSVGIEALFFLRKRLEPCQRKNCFNTYTRLATIGAESIPRPPGRSSL